MFKRRQFVPLITRITGMFAVLIIAVCVVAGVFSFRVELNAQVNAAISQNQMLLNSMATSITTRAAQIEIILRELGNNNSVASLLRSQRLEQQIVLLEFSVKTALADSKVYLSGMSPQMHILTTREDIVTTRDYIVNDSCMADNEYYQTFKASGGQTGWNFAEKPMLNDYFVTEPQAVHYYKVPTGRLSDSGGIIRCGVSQSILFDSLSSWSGDGMLYIVNNGNVVYTQNGATPELPESSGKRAWREDNTLYITHDIPNLDLKLVLALNYGSIFRNSMQSMLESLAIIALLGITLLLCTSWFLRRILSKLQSLTEAARNMPAQGYNVELPESGPDEVGQLSMAFNHLLSQINDSYDQLLQKEKDKRKAMTLALQYQINPHFLFNALYWLQLQVEEAGMRRELCDSFSQLGQVLHYNLDDSQTALVSEEELHMRAYVSFMQSAKNCNVTLDVDLPEEMGSWRILRFSLQPLLENSIQHGWTRANELHIRVCFSANREKNQFSISVENDGNPISDAQLQEIRRKITNAKNEVLQAGRHGVGLVNLMRRLELNYGLGAQMHVESEPGCTRFVLLLPLHLCENREEAASE